MNTFKGKTVLITGGASGIGKGMAVEFLRRGSSVIIWDINAAGLASSLEEMQSLGPVSGQAIDITDPEMVGKSVKAIEAMYGGVDILINNAGIVVGKQFHEHTQDDILRTMSVNSLAPMYITLGFLPGMIARKSGHICNITSSAGLTPNPKMSVYVASKWAATGWSDSLRIEMERMKTGVHVTTVTPYYIHTGMFEGVRSSLIPILQPETVVKKILRGLGKKKIYVSMPWSYNFVRLSQGVMPPRLYDFVAGKLLGIYSTMDHFTGRKD